MSAYERLHRESESGIVADHTVRWEKLSPVAAVSEVVRGRLEAFCASRRITLEALEALGARVSLRPGGAVELAYAGRNAAGRVTAVKYRPLGGSSDDSYHETRSVWFRPIVAGDPLSRDWFVAEGETDAARLVDLVARRAAVLVLPAGALTFKPEWAALVPRGATVFLAHDADEKGDAGAAKAAKLLGGRTVRLRPPDGFKDWCEWDGDPEAFRLLATAASTNTAGPKPLALVRLSEIDMRSIRFHDRPLRQAAALHLLAGRKGVGKGTMLADLAARVTRGDLGERRNVVWVSSEDSAAVDVKPRVLAARGDPARIFLPTEWLQLPRDVENGTLQSALLQAGDVGLLIIDPLGNHIKGKSANSDTDIRDAIAPLNALADELDLLLVGVRHLTEKEMKGGLLAGILGASAWVQIPRIVIGIARDDEDPAVSHVQCLAGNRLPPETPGRAFRIEGTRLDGLENEVTRAVWLGDSPKSVERLVAEVANRPRRAVLREIVLRELAGGERPRAELDAVCAEEAAATPDQVYKGALLPLREEGLVRARKDGLNGPWLWYLVAPTHFEDSTKQGESGSTRAREHTLEGDFDNGAGSRRGPGTGGDFEVSESGGTRARDPRESYEPDLFADAPDDDPFADEP